MTRKVVRRDIDAVIFADETGNGRGGCRHEGGGPTRARDYADIEGILEVQTGLDLDHIRRWLREFSSVLEVPEMRGTVLAESASATRFGETSLTRISDLLRPAQPGRCQ